MRPFILSLAMIATMAVADDCSTTANIHVHRRAVATEYATVTVIVLAKDHHSLQTLSVPETSIETSAPSDTLSSSPSSSASPSSSSSSDSDSSSHSNTDSGPTSSPSSGSTPSGSSLDPPMGDLSAYENPSKKFEDGTISCDDFPSGQGVIALDNLGFGGWSGIEYIHSESDIETGGKCRSGAYCSYACQSGMLKTQWPLDQPASGVSIGGLYCGTDNKLYRTNKDTDYLCEWGVDKAYVNNQVGEGVAVCRTDYPGTENMVIPTYLDAGNKLPLACPDQSTYYKWQGKPTSAQYYVNNAGVDWQTGCSWGDSGSDYGNWAPLNFGASYADGVAYLSLIPNPNNKNSLNFNVEIVAFGDVATVSGSCVYENGKYMANGGTGSDGCTVGVTNGKAQFRLYKL